MAVEAGGSATLQYVVDTKDTAVEIGSGDVGVLATPQVLAWCEAATVAAIAPSLDPDETTVGTEVRLEHLRPTPVGRAVQVEAVLTDVDGRRLSFDVAAHDDDGQIATGRVVRMLVNRTRFMERINSD
jgi:predicted thioesterase